MRPMIAAIADDYTGASDLANSWRKNGLRTVQAIGIPPDDVELDCDALVIALKIRSVPAEDAVSAALAAYAYLKARGIAHVMYKVCSTFDSTPKGNIGPVTDALLDASDARWALINSASPENGRTIYQGHLFVGSALLSDSPLRHHPLNPMTDSSLLRLFAQQGEAKVGLLRHEDLHAADKGEAVLAGLLENGARAIVADAISADDLQLLGRLALRSPISVGAAGLGQGLANAVVDGRPGSVGEQAIGPTQGPGIVLAGSCSAQTLKQIEHARASMPVVKIDVEALLDPAFDIGALMQQVEAAMADGSAVVAVSDDPVRVAQLQERHGQQRLSHVAEGCIADIAERLVADGVTRLVIAGGETSGAVIDRLAVRMLEIGNEIDPGVPAMIARREHGAPLHLALKSGNFGQEDFFAKALATL